MTGKLQTGQFMGVDIYGNVFEQVNTVLLAELDDDDYQSESLCVFNNTVLESGSSVVGGEAAIMDVAGVSGLEIYNNIIINPQGDVLLTRAPNNAVRINRLDYSDHNLYLSSDILNWHLDAGGSQDAAEGAELWADGLVRVCRSACEQPAAAAKDGNGLAQQGIASHLYSVVQSGGAGEADTVGCRAGSAADAAEGAGGSVGGVGGEC